MTKLVRSRLTYQGDLEKISMVALSTTTSSLRYLTIDTIDSVTCMTGEYRYEAPVLLPDLTSNWHWTQVVELFEWQVTVHVPKLRGKLRYIETANTAAISSTAFL